MPLIMSIRQTGGKDGTYGHKSNEDSKKVYKIIINIM